MRPIVMTAVATILALMPLAVVCSSGGLIAANLAMVVISGLLTSTGLTLVVVPVVYSLFNSLRGRMDGMLRWTKGKPLSAQELEVTAAAAPLSRRASGVAFTPDG